MIENNNNEKKNRIWGRRFFGEQATILISGAFVLCMFKFSDLNLGLKWFMVYALIIGLITGWVTGLLQKKDIKEILVGFNPLKKIEKRKPE